MAITKATASSIAPAAKGDLVVGSATNDAAVLGVGANNTVLTADSAEATGLKWATPSSGGMTLISTTTMSGTSVTLSSIPGTYTDLIFVMSGVTNSSGNGQLYISPNGNGSVTDNVGIIATSVYSVYDDAINVYGNTTSLRTDANNAFAFRISNYASTTAFKPFLFSGNFVNNASVARAVVAGGNFKSTSAVTSLVFALGGTTFNSGTILLYGVK